MYKRQDYGEGTLYGELPGILLVSDTKVAIAVASDPTGGLLKLYLGSTEYTLTRDADSQNVTLGNIDGASRVDVYSIGGGGLPGGNWEEIKIEGPVGTFIPDEAKIVRKKGLYHGQDNFWHSYLFSAPEGNINLPFTVPCEQTLPATPINKSLTFVAGDQLEIPYETQNPFDNVLRIEMQTQTGQPRPNQYTVVMQRAVSGNSIPVKLKVEGSTYDLIPVRGNTDHSFHTPTIPSANRVSPTVLERGMDIQYADGSWAMGGSGFTVPYVMQWHVLIRPCLLYTSPSPRD